MSCQLLSLLGFWVLGVLLGIRTPAYDDRQRLRERLPRAFGLRWRVCGCALTVCVRAIRSTLYVYLPRTLQPAALAAASGGGERWDATAWMEARQLAFQQALLLVLLVGWLPVQST